MRILGITCIPLALFGLLFFSIEKDKAPRTTDGPFVFYKDGNVYAKYISGEPDNLQVTVDSVAENKKETLALHVHTGEPGQAFQVFLKADLRTEKPDYKGVKKMFVLSDIEGNFRAFSRLLRANGVIDKDYNWTFGDGHLVLTGDFVDRGDQVAEVLWLIYSLEDKAKAAGGYVHFILGNHEIMNLEGDIRYVNPKYIIHAGLLNETYPGLFGEHTELGKWLRTKNVVERIGTILFMHAGISSLVNNLDISLNRLNKQVRGFYGDTSLKFPGEETELLYSTEGPFWYRGYYTGEQKAPESQIDSTLIIYHVKQIATGHTVIADTISVLHKGKLINTDVHHAGGFSEALLIDNGKYYRVDGVGQQFLIWE